MQAGVIFVRHAMPEIVRYIPSTLWRLSESAKEDCVLLAHALPANLASPVLTSGQPKVDETAAIVAFRRGLQVRVDPRVRETEEPPKWFDGDFRALVAR
jgi:Histidine phosphatase superfamily (branch 1)